MFAHIVGQVERDEEWNPGGILFWQPTQRIVTVHFTVRTCVIFNPTAKGDKARHFRHHLDDVGADASLMQTRSVGDARHLAAEAVRKNFEIIVAAGGDGTVNEVLNGIGDVSDGFERARLAVLPLGTVNVFAKELGMPTKLKPAWAVIRAAREARIDLPSVEFGAAGERRYFAQLAGAGLDARAIELVSWSLKKKIGPLAYVVAGLKALCGKLPQIQVSADGEIVGQASCLSQPNSPAGKMPAPLQRGELVLIGNGRFYGGKFYIFPQADLRDGLLEVCVFPHANLWTLLRCGPRLLLRGTLPDGAAQIIRTKSVTLVGAARIGLQVDGEWAGVLPGTFTVRQNGLRVIVP
jgi:diacylglycerol kinase family enzyme